MISDGQTARLADGTLAGSTLTLDRAVRVMASLAGARLEDALAMASTVPAPAIGLADTGPDRRRAASPTSRSGRRRWRSTATIIGGAIAYRRA